MGGGRGWARSQAAGGPRARERPPSGAPVAAFPPCPAPPRRPGPGPDPTSCGALAADSPGPQPPLVSLRSILSPTRQDESIQRIAVHLCNALVCQVDNDHKEAVGKMGFVVTMLKLIQKKLLDKTCDQVMEFSWSALWNITDETPDNCEMFLNFNGMKLFLDCLKEFPEKQELHRNMLGLLGNVAEVKELRPQLMTSQFISVFSNLLESKADGIEVSYNACGVLSHIMFDGPEAWGVCEPQRAEVEDRMWAAIQSWDINSRRNINYRSFEPILRLLPQGISPVSQHWATWALYNLVSVYPDKYCPLLIKEGGMPLLPSPSMASDTPESLMALCTDFCLRNLDGTLGYLLDKETLRLHPDIFLPSEICDQLVNEYVELVSAACTFEPHETFFSLFSDPRSTRLTRIHLREDLVQDQDLEAIRKQDLVELYLTNCEKLSAKSLQTLRSFRHSLVSLSLSGCANIFYEEDNPGGCEDECLVNPTCQVLVKDFTFEGFSRLRFLNLGRMIDGIPVESLLRPLNSLAALDLSGIQTSDATFLTQWKDSLMSLVLYNMDLSDDHIRVIVQLHKLRHLDISRDRLSSYYKFKLTRKVLSLLVQKLGNLMSLDISGHMILENCSISKTDEEAGQTSTEPSKSSIMPFRALKRPLQFLGLFETSLCRLTHIPAYKVSGDKNEEQVLNAIEAYTEHRPEITSRAINLLFDIARIERCNQLLRALKLVITALKCHKYDKNIQVTGSAALFYLTNSEYRSEQSVKLRRQVIQVVLNGMESYQEVQRNCCLTLCNFSIPEELEFQYRRVNELLLGILSPTRQVSLRPLGF